MAESEREGRKVLEATCGTCNVTVGPEPGRCRCGILSGDGKGKFVADTRREEQ